MPVTRATSARYRQAQASNVTRDEPRAPPAKRQRTNAAVRRPTSSNALLTAATIDASEDVDEEDICPICHLLLYQPVRTTCEHVLCQSCMAHWAESSATNQLSLLHIDELEPPLPIGSVLAKCPMCRSSTMASLDEVLAEKLARQYPNLYEERATEETYNEFATDNATIRTLTVYVGNLCEVSKEASDGFPAMYNWTFFVRPSRTDIIEEVVMLLHPSFRPSRIDRQRPPFEISRRGWGEFTIRTLVILKAGYSWLSPDAINAPDDAVKGALPLEWKLTFTDEGHHCKGRKVRIALRVRSDRGWDMADNELDEDEASWKRTIRSYAKDETWEPPADED